ncbi:inhibitor of apoptosis-promoting Bax1-domain-containing protein, partial [Catenaria anguillulae PL171]
MSAFPSYGSVPPPPAYGDSNRYQQVPGAYDYDPEAGFLPDKPVVFDCEIAVRNAFISKVYAILSLQLLTTTIMSAIFILNPSAKLFIQTSPGFLISALVLSFVSFSDSWWAIGAVVSTYDAAVVVQTLFLTLGVFASMSGVALYAARNKPDWDLTNIGSILSVLLIALVIFGFVGIFLPFGGVVETIYCALGVLVFTGLVLFDTWRIIKTVSPEEYVAASVDLYLDIINLFMFILRLLGDRDSE